MLTLYQEAAATCPCLPWTVLAAIGTVESDNGQSALPGVHTGVNSAGAEGPMQGALLLADRRCSTSFEPLRGEVRSAAAPGTSLKHARLGHAVPLSSPDIRGHSSWSIEQPLDRQLRECHSLR